MRDTVRAALAVVAALSLPSCAIDDPPSAEDRPGFDDDFARASVASGVPADLLAAVSYVETRWQMVVGEAELEDRPAGAGLFALWGDNLTAGAAAAQLDEATVLTDPTANIAAAAARLAELGAGVAGDDLAAWTPALAVYSQNPDDESRAAYANEVMRVLAEGATSIAEDGTAIATIDAHPEITPELVGVPRATTDYAGAIWRASPNYSSRSGTPVSLVVIHTCEGNYAGCWGWLAQSQSKVSAHYVVKESGAEITQLVRESNKAWHIAASYECSRAGNTQCNRNGQSTNNFSVGIEHAGFASQTSFPDGQIEASAKLTCDITRDHNVPRDRNHIVSHGQLQPWNRVDPGPNWPWSHYIDRVRDHCGDTGGGGGGGGGGGTGAQIIVDSNNANNNQAVGKIELAGTWSSSSSTSGYYGSGYWVAQTQETSAPATFWFYLASAQTRTIDAWWTTGSNRTTTAPFIAFNANGTEVGRRTVNQQGSGSQWVTLGAWSFTAGWNKVVLSRWAPAGKVVIADALRIR